MRSKREALQKTQPEPVAVSSETFRVAAIENWQAFTLPQVQDAMAHWRPSTDVAAWTELVLQVQKGKAFVLAGGEGNRIDGLLIVILPPDALWPLPYVAHARVEPGAHPKLKNALIDAGVAILRARGYSECWAINASGLPDEAWARAFRRGGRLSAKGTAFTITF